MTSSDNGNALLLAGQAAAVCNNFGAHLFNAAFSVRPPVMDAVAEDVKDGAAPAAALGCMISPMSIANVLVLLSHGSSPGSRTLQELQAALGLDKVFKNESDQMEAFSALQHVLKRIQQADPEHIKLALASSIWSPPEHAPADEFVTIARNMFDTEVLPLKSAQAINQWVAKATDGAIPSIVPDESLQSVAMMLVDAVYMKASWKVPFRPRLTKAEPFITGFQSVAGKQTPLTIPCDMMAMDSDKDAWYGQDAQHGQVLRLDYGYSRIGSGVGKLAFVAILPRLPAESPSQVKRAVDDLCKNLNHPVWMKLLVSACLVRATDRSTCHCAALAGSVSEEQGNSLSATVQGTLDGQQTHRHTDTH